MAATWCTQETVQRGAHPFFVRNSRWRCSSVYSSERNARIAALLRTIMHQAILADVEVARAGAAAPVVLLAARDVVLKSIDAREGLLFQRHDLFENFPLSRSPAAAVGRCRRAMIPTVEVKPSCDSAMRDGQSIFGIAHAATEHRIDVHVKFGVFGQAAPVSGRAPSGSSSRRRPA